MCFNSLQWLNSQLWQRAGICCLLCLPVCACSDNPASPATGRIQSADLIGDWTGPLPLLSIVPEASIPFRSYDRKNPLNSRRYDFHNLYAYVHITESDFLILVLYRSDSLYFYYEERGGWQISGGDEQLLRMDSTRVSGRLETWGASVGWDTIGCCWQAGLDLENVDPVSAGFDAQVLRIFDIQSRLAIGDLQLERGARFLSP